MKKTLIALMAMAGVAQAEVLLSQDFTKLSGYSQDHEGTTSVLPAGWYTGQWNGNNTPHYHFGENGATAYHPWKQNYLYTAIDLSSQANAEITFTLYNGVQDTGNMFYLSSDNYSIVIGNSYNSNPDIHVGIWNDAIGDVFVNFQKDYVPTVIDKSTGFNVVGDITYTLTLSDGDLLVKAVNSSGATWSTKLEGMNEVTFDTLGFINDGAGYTSGVKNVTLATVPEPATATLSLLALAGLAARRRRR